VIVDFTGLEGQTITLQNTAPDGDPETTGQVMQFWVVLPQQSEDESRVPDQIPGFMFLSTLNARVQRDITLSDRPDEFGRTMLLLEGVRWEDPISVTPRLGTTEVWRLINLDDSPHPIHVHLVQFQIINRQAFDVAAYFQTGKLLFTDDPIPPLADEQGWKDTVRSPPGFVTNIIMRFEDFPGQFPFHCHILEHEDHDMMRPYEVVGPEPDIGSPPGPAPTPPPGGPGPSVPGHGGMMHE
jgi:spore coat protein A